MPAYVADCEIKCATFDGLLLPLASMYRYFSVELPLGAALGPVLLLGVPPLSCSHEKSQQPLPGVVHKPEQKLVGSASAT